MIRYTNRDYYFINIDTKPVLLNSKTLKTSKDHIDYMYVCL